MKNSITVLVYLQLLFLIEQAYTADDLNQISCFSLASSYMVSTGDLLNTSSEIHHCVHRCQDSSITEDDVNQAFIINQLCFCSNQTVSFQSRDSTESQCDITNSTCPFLLIESENFTRTVDIDFELIVPDVLCTFTEFEIHVITNEETSILLQIDHEQWERFGTKLSIPFIFQTSGYHFIKALVDQSITKEFFINVKFNASNVEFLSGADVLEINKPFYSQLLLGYGSELNVALKFEFNGDVVQQLFFSEDIIDHHIGITNFPTTTTTTTSLPFVCDDCVIISPIFMSQSNGVLYKIDVLMKEAGQVTLMILRQQSVSLAGNITQELINLTSPAKARKHLLGNTYKVVQEFKIEAPRSGRNTISIYSQKIEIFKGDVFTCTLNNQIQMIHSPSSTSNNILLRSTLKLGDRITFDNSFESTSMLPALSGVFVQQVVFELPVVTPRDVGYFDVSLTSSDWTKETKELSKRRFTIQMPLVDLSLSVSFKKSLAKYQAIVTIPNVHTNVLFNFTVSPLNLQIESENGSITFGGESVTGMLIVQVTASNNISSLTTSTQLRAIEKIQSARSTLLNDIINLNDDVIVEIEISGGAYGNAMVLFEESKKFEKFFTVNLNEKITTVVFKYRYEKCGYKVITVGVENDITPLIESDDHTVFIACPISKDMVIKSYPWQLQNGEVHLPHFRDLTLNVSLSEGSFPNYTIKWDDGLSDNIDHSTYKYPEPFHITHQYEAFKYTSYDVEIKTCNEFSCTSTAITVSVKECGPPFLNIDPNNLKPFKKDEKELILIPWYDPFQNCLDQDLFYDFHVSDLVSNQKHSLLINGLETSIDFTKHQVKILIQPYTFDAGATSLNLTMKSQITEDFYQIPLTILPVTLRPRISGGASKVVQYMSYDEASMKQSFTIFHLNVTGNIDPEENDNTIMKDIQFVWECRLLSAHIEDDCQSTDSETTECCSKDFIPIGSSQPSVTIDAQYLISNRTYEFKVTTSKNDRLPGTFTQQVRLSSSLLPTGVNIRCKNCKEELNVQSRIVFFFECTKCLPGIRFDTRWSLLNQDGNVFTTSSLEIPGVLDKENLLIPPNTLPSNSEITVQLAISYRGEEDSAIFRRNIKTSQFPFGGRCQVSTKRCTVLDEFNFSCFDWQPFNKTFSFEMMIQFDNMSLGLNKHVRQYPDRIVGESAKMPLGNITIIIRVKNRFNQYIAYQAGQIEVVMVQNMDSLDVIKQLLIQGKHDHSDSTSFAVLSVLAFGDVNMNEKEDIKRNKEVRGMLIDSLEGSISPTSKLSPAVASGLQKVTSQTELLFTDTLDKLVGISSTIASSIEHAEPFDEDAQDTAHALLKTVGNLMNGQSKLKQRDNEDEGTNSTSSKENKIKDSMNNLVTSMDSIITAVANNQMVGQASSEGQTDAFNFAIKKVRADELVNQKVNGFKLPKTMSLNNTSDDISTVQVNYKKNIFFSENSNHIGSIVASLSLQSNGDRIEVSNLEHPIEIKLENQEDLLPGETIEFFIPGYLVTHTVKLDSVSCVLMLHIEPPKDLDKGTLLHILVQYAKAPTHDEHDFALTVDEFGGTKIILHDHHHHHEENSTLSEEHDEEEEKERGERLLEHLYMVEHTVMIWDWHKFKYGAMNNSKVYFVMWYDGINPYNTRTANNYTYDILEDHHHYKYNFKSYCVTCTYWDLHTNSWETDGCQVVPEETDIQYTICHCNHLTSFSSMMVPPSPLPRMSIALLKEGYVLFVMVGVILGLYVLFLVIFRKLDQIDAEKIGGCLLPSNQDTDQHFYRITISTSSATSSKVFIKIYGDQWNSHTVRLRDEHRRTFQSNGCDTFIMSTRRKLGKILSLKVYHDNSGGGWFIRDIEVEDLESTKMYFFYPNRWLAVEKNDGRVSCNLIPTVEEELSKDIQYLFFTKLRRDLFDGHIWFSLIGRPPRSIFTRCQRLSMAVCMLFTSMIANVMFYGQLPKQQAAVENDASNMAFSLRKLYIAVISSLVGIPVNVILNLLYRHIKPLPKVSEELKPFTDKHINDKKKHLEEKHKERNKEKTQSALSYASTGPTPNTATKQQKPYNPQDEDDIPKEDDQLLNGDDETREQKSEKASEPKMLPYWCLYPTLVLNILCILAASFFIIWYGMAFGNTRSKEWLASVSFGLFQGIFITQPIKVLLFAAFIAFVIKSIEREQKSILEEVFTRYVNHQIVVRKQQQSRERLDTDDDDDVVERNIPELSTETEKIVKPPSTTLLERQRQQRTLQLRLRKELIEISIMFLFTFCVYFLGYHLHDENAFLQTQSIRELLKVSLRPMSKARYKKASIDSFITVGSKRDVFPFIENTVLHATYPHEWYTNLSLIYDNQTEIKDFPGNIYTNNLYTKIVSPLSIRQVRVHSKRCEEKVEEYFSEGYSCYGQYGMLHQQKGDYNHHWNGTRMHPSSSEDDIMWRYRSGKETGSIMVQGELGIYLGGGYSVQLFPKQDNHEIIEHLLNDHWMNRGTRAILITYSVFNSGVNYFSSITLLLEFPNSAGVVKQHSISTFKAIKYSRSQTQVIVVEFFTVLMIIYYTVVHSRNIFHQRLCYFGSFWNLVDFSMVVSSIASIVIYIYRANMESRILSYVAGRKPNESISFGDVGFWGYGFTQSVACVNFFATIRLIRLLRLNRRTSLLEATLIKAKKYLYSYAIVFAIMMSGFIVFATMLFRTRIYEYRKLSSASAAVIRLLLGKYSFRDYQEAHLLLGPLFFMIFNVTCNWVMINMLISILDDASHEVKMEQHLIVSQEAQAISYFLQQLKGIINGTSQDKCKTHVIKMERELAPLPNLDEMETRADELELLFEQMLRDDYELDRILADTFVEVSPAISPNDGSKYVD